MYILKNLKFYFPFLLLTILYIFSAWVADDAYITFRTIENFHHGYGLRWNIQDRVATYTLAWAKSAYQSYPQHIDPTAYQYKNLWIRQTTSAN